MCPQWHATGVFSSGTRESLALRASVRLDFGGLQVQGIALAALPGLLGSLHLPQFIFEMCLIVPLRVEVDTIPYPST